MSRGPGSPAPGDHSAPSDGPGGPAAVLVLDVHRGVVVHADTRGLALGDVPGLPLPPAAWVAAAGLRPRSGQPYLPGQDPVSHVAAGQPVLGLPVRLGERLLWATGYPLPVRGQHAQALLVLLDADPADPADTGADARVRDRAVVAAGLSFTISDPRLPDNPLVFVNPAFERTTGWSAQASLGRNCRFLQSPDTDPAAVARIRELLRTRQHGVVVLLNQRRDGTPFWNELAISPVHDGSGQLTHFVGIQSDVTDRVLGEQQRERHLRAEQQARAEAETAQARLALLAEATTMLAGTLEVDEALRRLTRLAVPLMADWCTVHVVAEDGQVRRTASAHADDAKLSALARLEELQPYDLREGSTTLAVLRGGAPALVRDLDPAWFAARATPELAATYDALGYHDAVVVPLRARDQVLGVLTLMTDGSGRRYDEQDLRTAADLARRAALAVDNARLYEREHRVAEQLQRSLLPVLPDLPGLDLAARYLPGATAAQVGGDWYDVFPLRDGSVGVAIGDVMGHDLAAAAAMGQLRSVLRSYAWQGDAPGRVLEQLDQLVQALGMAQLATAVYGRLELPADGSPGELTWSNAGHLPPVLRTPDGRAVLLDAGASVLVGVDELRREQARTPLVAGSVLVLCTDGLVERRDRDPDAGLERLRSAVQQAGDLPAEQLCDALLASLADRARDDDTALLVVRVR